MPFEPINPPQFPAPIAPYSAGAKAGGTVYVSGVLALGEGGTVLPVGDAAAPTRHVLDVQNGTRHRWKNPGDKPARYCVRCDQVKPDCLVEIASVAHL